MRYRSLQVEKVERARYRLVAGQCLGFVYQFCVSVLATTDCAIWVQGHRLTRTRALKSLPLSVFRISDNSIL